MADAGEGAIAIAKRNMETGRMPALRVQAALGASVKTGAGAGAGAAGAGDSTGLSLRRP